MNQQKSWNCVGLVRAIAEEQMCLIKSFSKKKKMEKSLNSIILSPTFALPIEWVYICQRGRLVWVIMMCITIIYLFI